MGLISQRPVELSDTVISQCTNILIFKINHPVDVEYIRKMVPNITDEIIEKQKSLQPGTCLGFGLGFKIPIIVKMEMPNPSPLSSNCDVVRIWSGSNHHSAHSAAPAVVAPTTSALPEITAAPSVAVSAGVSAISVNDDPTSVANLMQTMVHQPNLINIVENVETPAEPVVVAQPVVEQVIPPVVENTQNVVQLQSSPVTVPIEPLGVAVPVTATNLGDEIVDNDNFVSVPDVNSIFAGNGENSANSGTDSSTNNLINLTTE